MILNFDIRAEAHAIAAQLGYADALIKVIQIKGLARMAYAVFVKPVGAARGFRVASVVVC